MFLSGLDDTDRRIVELLIHNARMSYSDLGEAVGLSRVAVKARIRALEERGVIEEYTTIVNPQRISGAVSCYFEIEVEPAWFPRVVDTLRDNETVTQIYQVSGNNKLHVHAVAAGQEELEAFLDGVIHRLPGVTGLSCNIILSRIKYIMGLRRLQNTAAVCCIFPPPHGMTRYMFTAPGRSRRKRGRGARFSSRSRGSTSFRPGGEPPWPGPPGRAPAPR